MKNDALMPIERTLYSPISELLLDLGFNSIQEIRSSDEEKYIDLLFSYEGYRYILEVKIGDDYKNLLKGLVQIHEYSEKTNIKNKIVVLFPEDIRQAVYTIDEIKNKIKYVSCKSLFLTESWWDLNELSLDQSFNELKSRIDKKLSASKRIEMVSKLLSESVKSLSKLINLHYNDYTSLTKVLDYLTRDQGLFINLSGETKRGQKKLSKIQQAQIISLMAYILINQILFYFLYSKKTLEIPILKEISSFNDLKIYFDKIKNIDFKPIFDIDVISRIPRQKEILNEVNTIINSLNPLEVENLKHDLYGRLIGKAMPEETRKTLASYYTKVTSAEILTQLAIEKWDQTIWDTACGSGTILVSAYNKKFELYDQIKGLRSTTEDKNKLHKKFIEKQITGTDIMPFACHLTGLNLSAQNLNVHTNFMRISNNNSLELIDLSKPLQVREAYGDIANALEGIRDPQNYLDEYFDEKKIESKKISQQSKTFVLEKPDLVLINPPFTTLNKLSDNFRKAFSKDEITKICGKEINLWGYFLAHTDLILKNSGKFGAIIPITFLRGKRTKKIRTYVLENYSLEYIIKPPINYCFSEDSKFPDIIVIAKKVPYDKTHECKLIYLNGDFNKKTIEDIKLLIKKIKSELEDEKDLEEFSIHKIPQSVLYENRDNLMPYFFSNKILTQRIINSFIDRLFGNKSLKKMEYSLMEDGFQLRGKEKPKYSVITRYLGASRIIKSRFYFDSDTDPINLSYHEKDIQHKIEKIKLIKTFRTSIDVNVFDISYKFDYLMLDKTINKKSTNLLIPNRFPPTSQNIFATAFYSDEKITPTNSFIMYDCPSKDEAKILCLFLQSIFYLAQIIRICKRSIGEGSFADFIEIKQDDLKEIYIPDFIGLNKNSKDVLIEYFNKNKDLKLHELINQIKNKTEERLELDILINNELKLGFSKDEIIALYKAFVSVFLD
ncbi:MAG: SAM-dependent methyltransferase [Candidatus Methanofastidiosum sp.]|nr:SAM-dependent methyltransferase [Methanofastidiosum sp.]